MLAEFIDAHLDVIVERSQQRVFVRMGANHVHPELINGISRFLDQLCRALRLALITDEIDHDEISLSATRHGSDLFKMGMSIGHVVHEYGDICQVITQLILEEGEIVSTKDFRTFNLCLDDAIAGAVTEYATQHDEQHGRNVSAQGTERLGILAHELRNSIGTATLSFEMIRLGRVACNGSTGAVLARSLMNLKELVDRSLADVRLDADIQRVEVIPVFDFLDEIEIGASLQARSRNLNLRISPISHAVNIQGDRQILAAAVSNMLQNAFKFTRKRGNVTLHTTVTKDRVLFGIEDECGGLPAGKIEDMFVPYTQAGVDRSGVGLGLSICLKAAKANHGEIRVRDVPGTGCVFTLDLPKSSYVS